MTNLRETIADLIHNRLYRWTGLMTSHWKFQMLADDVIAAVKQAQASELPDADAAVDPLAPPGRTAQVQTK